MYHRLSVYFEHNFSLLQFQTQQSIFLWPLNILGVQLMCPLCQMRCILFEKGKKLSGMNFFLINEVDLLLEWATPKLHLNDWIIAVWNPSWMQLPHQLRESTKYSYAYQVYEYMWGVMRCEWTLTCLCSGLAFCWHKYSHSWFCCSLLVVFLPRM